MTKLSTRDGRDNLREKVNAFAAVVWNPAIRGTSPAVGDIYASVAEILPAQGSKARSKTNGEAGYYLRMLAKPTIAAIAGGPPNVLAAWERLTNYICPTFKGEQLRGASIAVACPFETAEDLADALALVMSGIAHGRPDLFPEVAEGRGIITSEVSGLAALAQDASDRALGTSPTYLEREMATGIDRMWKARIARELLHRHSPAVTVARAKYAENKDAAVEHLCAYCSAAGILGATEERISQLLELEPHLEPGTDPSYKSMYAAGQGKLQFACRCLRVDPAPDLPSNYDPRAVALAAIAPALAPMPAQIPAPAPASAPNPGSSGGIRFLVYTPGLPRESVETFNERANAEAEAKRMALAANKPTYLAAILGRVDPPAARDLKITPYA